MSMQPALTIDQALQAAFQAHRAGRAADARQLVNHAIKAQGDNPKAHHLAFAIDQDAGREVMADLHLRRALVLDPTPATPWAHLAILRRSKEPDTALPPARRARLIHPGEPYFLTVLAGAEASVGDMRRADLHARMAEMARPNQADGLKTRANLLKRNPDSRDQIRELRKLVQLVPTLIEAHRELADTLRRVSRDAEAETVMRRAVDHNPTSTLLARDLTLHFLAGGRMSEAERILAQARAAGIADPGMIATEADLRANRGQMAEAIAMLRQLDIAGQLPENMLATLGFWCLHDSQAQVATGYFERAATVEGDEVERAILTAMGHLARGEPADADAGFVSLGELGAARIKLNYRASTADMMRVDPAFHAALERDDPITRLPGFSWIRRLPDVTEALLITIDANYFERYRNLIEHNLSLAGRPAVHLHLIDPPSGSRDELSDIAEAWNIALTIETSALNPIQEPLRRAYYSSVRFCRAWQFLDAGDYRAIAPIDVDGVWKAGLTNLFDDPDMRGAIGHLDFPQALPWARFNASLSVFRADPTGQAWLGRIARHIAHFLVEGTARWRLDQCAIHCAWWLLQANDHGSALSSLNRFQAGAVRFFKKGEEVGASAGTAVLAAAKTGEAGEIHAVRQFARSAFGKGRTEQAISAIRDLIAQHPDNSSVMADLIEMLIEAGEWEEARDLAESGGSQRYRKLAGEIRAREARQAAEIAHSESGITRALNPGEHSDHPILARLARSFSDGTPRTDPMHHRILSNLFEPQLYTRLSEGLADYDTHWGGNAGYQNRGHIHLDADWGDGVWPSLHETFSDPRFVDLAVRMLGAEAAHDAIRRHGCHLHASTNITIDRLGYSLGPHRDHPVRFATLLAYLPRDDAHPELGTSIYRPLLEMPARDGGIHHPFDLFVNVGQAPFLPNSGLLFLNIGQAYHGVEPVRDPVPRPMIQVTIYIRANETQ